MISLQEYRAKHGISQKTMAERIGRDQSIVSRLERGDIRPTVDLALLIEDTTAGEVPVRVWASHEAVFPSDPSPSSEAVK